VQPGTYREHLVIKKTVTLIGYGAVLVPPAQNAPTSPCSAPGPNTDGICIAGRFTTDPNTGATTVQSYVRDVRIFGMTVKGFPGFGIGQIGGSGSTFIDNRAINDGGYGIVAFSSTDTTEISNYASGAGEAGFYIGDSPHANATLIGNTSVGNMFGFFVRNAEHGTIVGNDVHDNCLGILFLADAPGPAGAFTVVGNSIRHNNKACPGTHEAPTPLSGIGVLINGAHDVAVNANTIVDNVAGKNPTAASAGVGVVKGQNGHGTAPANNHVQANVILHNTIDVIWDRTGTGNTFTANVCETSRPAGICH
jgi:hypothetical protein